MNKYLASSIDPTKLSNTIKGIIISLSSLIILFASTKGIVISNDQVVSFAEQIAQTVSAVGFAIGCIHTVYGLVVKGIHAITKPKA